MLRVYWGATPMCTRPLIRSISADKQNAPAHTRAFLASDEPELPPQAGLLQSRDVRPLPRAHRFLNLVGVDAVAALRRSVARAAVAGGGADPLHRLVGDCRPFEAGVVVLGAEDVHGGL